LDEIPGNEVFDILCPGLLCAKIFIPDQVEDIVKELRENPMNAFGFKQHISDVTEAEVPRLQRFVRTQFLCLPKSRWSSAWGDFVSSKVHPCLEITSDQCSAPLIMQAKDFASRMSSGSLNTLEDMNLKLACHVAAGCLNSHPLVQGVLVAAIEKARREERGITNMKGLKLSPLEMAAMAESGVAMSMAAGNMSLVRSFGLSFAIPRLPLSNLHAKNLPESFLSCVQGDILRKNVQIISQLLRRKTDSGSDGAALHHRNLTLAFDRTYLLQGVDIVGLRAGRGFIGEAFNIDSLKTQPIQKPPDLSGFLPLRDHQNPWDGVAGFGEEMDEIRDDAPGDGKEDELSWDAANLNYANEMAEFLLWDPSFKSLPRFSCCCVPVAYKTSGMQMICLLGHILEKTEGKVRTIVFDNATSHGLIKRFLLGLPHHLTQKQLQDIPFFNKITWEKFPTCVLPRWPFQRPMIGQDALFLGLALSKVHIRF
jgi:hypothetical protein